MQTKVSVRGQTVIPQEIRQALGISCNTILRWKVLDGTIVVYPVPRDPAQSSLGMLKDKGLSLEDFLNERQRDRDREANGSLCSR